MTVSIFDGRTRLQLMRAGDPEAGYPVSSYPTEITVTTGPFSAIVKALPHAYAAFLEELSQLHKSMAGVAKLRFWNEAHSIVLTGTGNGRIALSMTIVDSVSNYLRVNMAIDQSYLPQIISGLKEEFPI